ncbi:hypothetical protein [uncultured Nitratireductor sp.]|uniref:hypothetical protein n=1 Tax=uncultured Nitratireductor sp. TaxID=520953 RepID=UPI0025F1B73A|nr:hypothetical protein [uncultured Nitratireductor sp.]
MHEDLQLVEQRLTDLEGLVTAMLFVGEHADDEELANMRACTVSLLHLMSDAISAAGRDVARAEAARRSLTGAKHVGAESPCG